MRYVALNEPRTWHRKVIPFYDGSIVTIVIKLGEPLLITYWHIQRQLGHRKHTTTLQHAVTQVRVVARLRTKEQQIFRTKDGIL